MSNIVYFQSKDFKSCLRSVKIGMSTQCSFRTVRDSWKEGEKESLGLSHDCNTRFHRTSDPRRLKEVPHHFFFPLCGTETLCCPDFVKSPFGESRINLYHLVLIRTSLPSSFFRAQHSQARRPGPPIYPHPPCTALAPTTDPYDAISGPKMS